MLDQYIIDLAQRRIALQIEAQARQLEHAISDIKSRAIANGASLSSRTALAIDAACADAVKERASLVWAELHGCVSAVGLTYDEEISLKLKEIALSYFPEAMPGLSRRADEYAIGAGLQNRAMNHFTEVDNARESAITRLSADIDFFVLGLKKNSQPVNAIPTVNNFSFSNSHVGTVQTGSHAVANVQQYANPQLTDLIDALASLQAALSHSEHLDGHDKAEVIELVAEGAAEVTKPKPNRMKLRSHLETVGKVVNGSLSAASNLKPAYEGVKAAARGFGIELP